MKRVLKSNGLRIAIAMLLLVVIVSGLMSSMAKTVSAANTQHNGEYQLKYNCNGVSPYTYEKWIGAGSYASIDAAPSRAGYVFGGWKCDDGKIYKPGQVIRVLKNMKFTAIWEVKATISYTFIYAKPSGNGYVMDRVVTKSATRTVKYKSTVGSLVDSVGPLYDTSKYYYTGSINDTMSYRGYKDGVYVNEACSRGTFITGDATINVSLILFPR